MVRSYRTAKEETAREYEGAFRAGGLGGPEDEPVEVGRRVANSGARDQLVAALDDWAVVTTGARREWALRAARSADPDPVRDRLRDPTAWADSKALTKVVAEAPPDALPPGLAAAVGFRLSNTTSGEQFLRAVQLRRPGDYWVNYALGNVLCSLGKVKEGETYFRAMLAARPDSASARINLAFTLLEQDSEEDPEPYLRKALELDPTAVVAYINLGEIQLRRGRPEEEVALARKALEFLPDEFAAQDNLAQGLLALGRYTEARAALRRALANCPADHPQRKAIEEFERQAEHWEQLSAALARDGVPPGGVAFAEAWFSRKYFTAAARAYAGALADDPGLADDSRAGCALKAARAAALAASGQGKEPSSDFDDRRHFRGQARRWLEEEVTRLKRQAGGGSEAKAQAASRLQRLMADDDLTGVRDAGAQMPDAEWKSWNTFWSQVRALLDETGPAERPVVLRAADARVHGSTLRLENRPDANLAYWSNPTEYAEWLVKDVRPRKYRLSLTHACGGGCGGNYIVTVGGQARRGRSRSTGGWQEYLTVELGQVTLPAGDTTVSVRAEGVIQNALMDLRSLTLTPVPEPWYREAISLLNRGEASLRRGELAQARRLLEQAVREEQKAREMNPKNERVVGDLLQSYQLLIETLIRQKDQAEAARVAAERARIPHDAAGLMELARFATHKMKLFTAASGLCQDAFRAHPDWADAKVPPQPNGLPFTNRRFAAAAAVMAAAGEGDGTGLTQQQRAAWRRQALEWLRGELGVWRQRLDGATPEARADIVKLVADVKADGWLASVRDAAHIDGLPADERDAWRTFWAEVEGLRR